MSYLWTVAGWKSNLRDYLQSPASIEDKLDFIDSYADWLVEDAISGMPDCDDCERIHPDDIGEYMSSRYEI